MLSCSQTPIQDDHQPGAPCMRRRKRARFYEWVNQVVEVGGGKYNFSDLVQSLIVNGVLISDQSISTLNLKLHFINQIY